MWVRKKMPNLTCVVLAALNPVQELFDSKAISYLS